MYTKFWGWWKISFNPCFLLISKCPYFCLHLINSLVWNYRSIHETLLRSSVHMCKLNFGKILWNRLYINCILNLTYRPCLSFSTEKKCSLILHFGMELRYGLYISEEREIYRKKIIVCYFREAAKNLFLKAKPLRGGGGERVFFFFFFFFFFNKKFFFFKI